MTETKKTLSLREQEVARIMKDPVLWIEAHLGQKPRWYQEQALRHPHNRVVLRWGRRLGKCIAGDQRVANSETGEYKTLDELFEQQNVPMISMNDNFKLNKNTSFKIEKNGIKPTFNVKTKAGASVTLTGNHPVLTMEGWKEVDMLKVGEEIATPKRVEAFGKDAPGLNRAKVWGYLTASHGQTKTNTTLRLGVEETRNSIIELLKEEKVSIFPKTPESYYIMDTKREFSEILNTPDEIMPEHIYRYEKEHLAAFLAAMFDIKGWVYVSNVAEVGFPTKSEEFAKILSHLLLRFGIRSFTTKRKMGKGHYYHVIINSKLNLTAFLTHIAPYSLRDYGIAKEKLASTREIYPSIPKVIWKYLDEQTKKKGMMNREVTGSKDEKFKRHVGLTEDKARRYAHNLQDEYLHDLASSDVYWDKVTAITPAGEQMTYDVHMPENHNLIVEDVMVHNTWTMAGHMLWAAFTDGGGTQNHGQTVCLVATPYDTQARLIYDQLKTFIESSEILKSSVKAMTKNPYYIEFKNGAAIKLYTAGTKAGQGGASLRGQKASYLYLDKSFVPSWCEPGRITM